MHLNSTLGLCLLGFALPVLALIGLLLRPSRQTAWLRAAPFAVTALGAGLAWALGLWLAPAVLAVMALLFLAMATSRGGQLLDRAWAALSRTSVQWCVLFLTGPALAAGAVCWGNGDESTSMDGGPPNALADFDTAKLHPVQAAQAVTDAGNPVALHRVTTPPSPQELRDYERRLVQNLAGDMIATETGTLASNCHGWVFTGGRYWVHGDAVDRIVKDNGYREVKVPRAGDLVVYRQGDGKVMHSGVVRYVDERGGALVESKWGTAGRFLHPADRHCYVGADPIFFRSPRTGHLLQGLDNSTEGQPGAPVALSQGAVPEPEGGADADAAAIAEAQSSSDTASAD